MNVQEAWTAVNTAQGKSAEAAAALEEFDTKAIEAQVKVTAALDELAQFLATAGEGLNEAKTLAFSAHDQVNELLLKAEEGGFEARFPLKTAIEHTEGAAGATAASAEALLSCTRALDEVSTKVKEGLGVLAQVASEPTGSIAAAAGSLETAQTYVQAAGGSQ